MVFFFNFLMMFVVFFFNFLMMFLVFLFNFLMMLMVFFFNFLMMFVDFFLLLDDVCGVLFIGPESDRWECLSVTHSLTH